jgi:predicted transcriptional regulator
MTHLQFLNNLIANDLAVNPARVLLYILDNPKCQQKDMLEPLNIGRPVLSQCCRMLMHRGFIYQEGTYINKKHSLTGKGIELIKKIKSYGNTQST